jgi:hypothetical protein
MDGFLSECEISVVFAELRPLPGVDHAPLDLAGGAVELPPAGFDFEQIAERMFGLLLLNLVEELDGCIGIAGIEAREAGFGFRGKRRRLARAGVGTKPIAARAASSSAARDRFILAPWFVTA